MQALDPHLTPVGYLALMERYRLPSLAPFHRCFVAKGGGKRVEKHPGYELLVFPPSYMPEDTLAGHLRFALRYDGVELGILRDLFEAIDVTELECWIRDEPTGRYSRRVWFLYEWLTGGLLGLDDSERLSYVDAVDADRHYTASPLPSRRHHVRNNLPGTAEFCPMVRRTQGLAAVEASSLDEKCRRAIEECDPVVLTRAVNYLFTKETKSSFAIEQETASPDRAARFIASLESAGTEDFFSERKLSELQNRIVAPRYAEEGYRRSQNYVAQRVSWDDSRIHFVSPRPTVVRSLMEGLVQCQRRLEAVDSGVHPLIHAAVVSFGFVYIHPFEDGNGRIHRFLIHHILSKRGFTPTGVVLPVSAAMLNDMATYDQALEAFSRPLMERLEFDLDGEGVMSVATDATHSYRYVDLTVQAEALAKFVTQVVEHDLVLELKFIRSYDTLRTAVQAIVDAPDRRLDLLLKLLRQNHGQLSKAKRRSEFAELTDQELERIEEAYSDAMTSVER